MSNHAFVSINILPMGLNTKYLLRRFINVLTGTMVLLRSNVDYADEQYPLHNESCADRVPLT
jgi:hypothetical protein